MKRVLIVIWLCLLGVPAFAGFPGITTNGKVNPQQFSGSDFGAKIGTAIGAACVAGNPCPVIGPASNIPQSFPTAVSLGANRSFTGSYSGGLGGTSALTYSGNGSAFSLTGKGSGIFNTSLTLGTGVAAGITASAGATAFQTIDHVFMTGGASGAPFIKLDGSGNTISDVTVSNNSIYSTTPGAIGVKLVHTNDMAFVNNLFYGPQLGGTADSTTQVFVCDSACAGLYVAGWRGGDSGFRGYVMQDVADVGHPPSEANIDAAIFDCPRYGSPYYFGSSLGTDGIHSTFENGWGAGGGQDCSPSHNVITANVPGIDIEGGGQIFFTNYKVRSNTGPDYINNSAGTGNSLYNSYLSGACISTPSCTTSTVVEGTAASGFAVIGNFCTNGFDDIGFANYCVEDDSGSGASGIIAFNRCESMVLGCVLPNHSGGKVLVFGNMSPSGTADQPNQLWSDLAFAYDTARKISTHIFPTYGAASAFQGGMSVNVSFDTGTGDWHLDTDGSTNGGIAILGGTDPNGSGGIYVFPSTGGSSREIAPGSLGTYQVATWNSGKLEFIGSPEFSSLATGTGSYVCVSGSPLVLTTEATACPASDIGQKNPVGHLTPLAASKKLDGLQSAVFTYKDKKQYGTAEHVGLYAQDVEKMDKRCVAYDKKGKIQNYDPNCVISYLVADRHTLESRLDHLERRVGEIGRRKVRHG